MKDVKSCCCMDLHQRNNSNQIIIYLEDNLLAVVANVSNVAIFHYSICNNSL